MRFAVPQVSGRRTDQLGDFMAVLELGATDLDYCSRILQKSFGCASTVRVFGVTRLRRLPMPLLG